jgi:hypothetical protein
MNNGKEFFRRLRSLGIALSVDGAGRLSFDAPTGVMTSTLMDDIRAHKFELLSILESIAERSAIMEHDGNMSREAADRMAIEDIIDRVVEDRSDDEMPVGVICPFCSSRQLVDDPGGMRCRRCSRLAWILVGRSIVRADWEKTDLSI